MNDHAILKDINIVLNGYDYLSQKMSFFFYQVNEFKKKTVKDFKI